MKIRLVTMGRFHTYHQQILLHGPEEVTYEANISTGLYANPLYSYFRRLYRSKLLRRILGKNFNDFPHAMLHVCARPPKKKVFSSVPNVRWHDILPQAKYFDLLRRADVFVRPEKHTPAMGVCRSHGFWFTYN